MKKKNKEMEKRRNKYINTPVIKQTDEQRNKQTNK